MNDVNRHSRLIRVLVVDDSSFMRATLTRIIESDPALSVSGTARDGLEGLEKIKALQPHVVTLDVAMPGPNGVDVLRRIMRECARPVIMVSSATQEGAETTLEALACGAFDYVAKQSSSPSLTIWEIRDDLIAKIKAAAGLGRPQPADTVTWAASTLARYRTANHVPPSVVAVGTSTGGPQALEEVLPQLPTDLPVAVLIVQHMPPGFTAPFAKRLNGLCKVSVREAAQNDLVQPGVVYIAPAGQHMLVYRVSVSKVLIRLSRFPAGMSHMPSVDVLMLSVAEVFQASAMGIIMTGMGSDGSLGMQAIFRAGGMTIGQDQSSCVVYSMPRACAEMGILQRVSPLPEIAQQILQATHYRQLV